MTVYTRIDLSPAQVNELELTLADFSEKYGALDHGTTNRLCRRLGTAPVALQGMTVSQLIDIDGFNGYGYVERWACRWLIEGAFNG